MPAVPSGNFDPARVEQASADARRAAEQAQRDFDLAAQPGNDPEREAARRRVVAAFFALHLPDRLAPEAAAYVETIDLRQPIAVVNVAEMNRADLSPRRKIFGFGKREQYLVGERFKPARPDDMIYALRSFVRKR
jgi:hypothetical protein